MIFCLFLPPVVSPNHIHPALSRMNELVQAGIIDESHCHLQEVCLFSSVFGKISEDPLRGMRSLHSRFPAAVFLHELIRNSVSGRQAYNVYLGKHNVGKHVGGIKHGMSLPSPSSVNHFGLSPSSWVKKEPVPMIFDGVFINFIEILQDILPEITKVKMQSTNNLVVFGTLIFDQKAVSPGLCKYQNLGLGVLPVVTPIEAVDLLENGYSKMLQKLIADFKNSERSWVKNGEVFFFQLLDYFVAIPIAVFYLSKSGQWNDVLSRLKTVLKYLSSCNECLSAAKATGRPPNCRFFCKECFKLESVCRNHNGIYEDWNCDNRPCETCMLAISQGSDVTCKRLRILLSISDQDSAYEKMGKHISQAVAEYLSNDSEFSFPICHIHDVGHQVKNAQASLERGTHFDGQNVYDATYLSLIMSTGSNEVAKKMNVGVAHGTLAQLDKHSDEQALQRISKPVTEACLEVDTIVRTDIPELRRPWFAENHSDVISPLFIIVSRFGVVFYTDQTKNWIAFYRQTPLPRKLIAISGGVSEDIENVPLAPKKVNCKLAKWNSITGLAFVDDETKLIVLDTKLPSVRLVMGIKQLWRSPHKSLDITRLDIHGQPESFHPFAIKTRGDDSRRLLLTDPKASAIFLGEISEDWTVLRILRNIKVVDIKLPVSCFIYTQDTLIVTDVDEQTPAVHFVTIEAEARKIFSFSNPHLSFKFPFDICESNGHIFVSDNERHCVFELDITSRSMAPVFGVYDDEGEEDGPVEHAKLSYPSGLASRGSVIYIGEHPREFQGAIRLVYSLKGLGNFQEIWQGIAFSMGLISKRNTATDPELARVVKLKKLRDSHHELGPPAERLKLLIAGCKERTGAESLDITHGSMASRTAQGVFHTLVQGQKFLLHYFARIKHEELLEHILAKLLNDSLAEAFFGHMSEMVASNNLNFLQMAQLISKEAFHYLLVVLSSAENSGVSIRRTRDERPGKYFYSTVDDSSHGDASQLLWTFFHVRHEKLFTAEKLRNAKSNPGKECSEMFFIGEENSCASYVEKISVEEPNREGENALKAVHMALKSRKMKTLRDFQKRRYGTAPTIIGQHASRIRTAIPEIAGLFPQQDEQIEQDVDLTPDANDHLDAQEDNLFEVGEVAVFRGTDGLNFNLLKITKTVKVDVNPKTRIKGNFLIENKISDDGTVTFSEDPAWRGSTMAFAHILRDKDETIVTVSLTEISTLNETLYQMDKETYDEIVSVSYDFEYSLEQERQNRIDQEQEEGPPSATDESDDENQSGVAENRSVDEVNYIEKRSRKGKGNRYNDILFMLKYS